MPWDETDQYIRSGHRTPGSTCRTITISDDQGIKAIYCKYGATWGIQSYLFSKAKGWNMSKAKSWFSSHKETIVGTEKLNPNSHTDFIQFYNDFINLYDEELGDKKYYAFLKAYGLDETKSYASQLTRECLNGVCEAFQWTKPLIQYIRDDKDAKYYKVRALTASLSANKNDYRDLVELEKSARTMAGAVININHDHSRTLPHPDNKVVWAEYEDKAVEAVIKIHNNQKDIQDKLDNGEIVNPSIEGDPLGGYTTPEGTKVPVWYNFTALALLEKDKTLPGVPSTYGFEPLFLNESLGRSLVESLSMEKDKTKEKTMTTPEKVDLEATKQLKEYTGIQGMDVCGQCKFYEELTNTTTQASAAPGSDGTVTHSAGAVGPGVGKCSVTGGYIRKADSVCTDGRPRDRPTDLDRTIEMKEIELEAKNMVLGQKVVDLENQVLLEKQQTRAATEGKLAAMNESLAKDELNKRQQLDIAESQAKVATMTERLEKEDLANRKLSNENAHFKVKSEALEEDMKLFKERLDRLQIELTEQKTLVTRLTENLKRATTKANDESALRAQAVQRAIDAENNSAEIQGENALYIEQLSGKSQEIYDSTKARSEGAKREMKLQEDLRAQRERYDKLTEEYRELKRLYNELLAGRKKIKVQVKV